MLEKIDHYKSQRKTSNYYMKQTRVFSVTNSPTETE